MARRAGVSVGTVSNVFNGRGRLTEETRRRVLQVASELHFHPNALVRSLQKGQTNTIGVVWFQVEPAPARSVSLSLLRG
ncbi:MAG: LacI family DNA-binding transcriptional regulator, partial [Armatimonadota bacterium]|nr:LacI family DNA-binding transcriptional regulator [Armatimonadota bacterium]